MGATLSRATSGSYLAGDLGIRVWKRSSGGAETEVTGGSPVAVVTFFDGDFHVSRNGILSCSEAALASTDSIVVRVYYRFGLGSWAVISSGGGVFTTERLSASKLEGTTWTICYVGSFTFDMSRNRSSISFHFDGSDESKISGFLWVSAGVQGELRMVGDGLTWLALPY